MGAGDFDSLWMLSLKTLCHRSTELMWRKRAWPGFWRRSREWPEALIREQKVTETKQLYKVLNEILGVTFYHPDSGITCFLP